MALATQHRPWPTDDVRGRAARIRIAGFDVDGTLTDGRLWFDGEGRESKAFHVHDGQGLVLLRQAGIVVVLVTARSGHAVERRARELGVELQHGIEDKLACARALCERHGCDLQQLAFMGDDLPDLPVLEQAGLSAAPADAQACVGDRVHWRSRLNGGAGAVREFCELLLAARNGQPPPPAVDGRGA